MTTKIIRESFIKYLNIVSEQYITELQRQKALLPDYDTCKKIEKILEEHKNYIASLKENLKKGYCFGFSVCHGAMDVAGKLNWWEHALVEIAKWDGSPGALEKEIVLPDTAAKKSSKLSDIFNRVLNYILFNFAYDRGDQPCRPFMPVKMDQFNFLAPDGCVIPSFKNDPEIKKSFFELLDPSGNIKTIKQRKTITGHFTQTDLRLLLDEHQIIDTICLIHSINHTIRVGYKDSAWLIYDPNGNHTNRMQIHKTGTKDEIIAEIFLSLGTQALTIEVASVDQNHEITFPHYDKLLKDSPLSLISDGGLSHLATYSERTLLSVFRQADTTQAGLALRSAIASCISVTNSANWTGFHMLAFYAPKAMLELFRLADLSKEGLAIRSAIASAIVEKDSTNNWTGLHMLARNAPEAVSELFKLADTLCNEGRAIRAALAKVLITKDQSGRDGFNLLATCAPQALPGLFRLVDASVEGQAIQSAIASALVGSASENETGLYWLTCVPEYLSQGLTVTLQSDDKKKSLELVLQALAVTTHNKTGWQRIKEYAPLQQDEIIKLLFAQLKELDRESLSLLKKNIRGALYDTQSIYHGLCKEHLTFFRNNHPTTLWQELMREIEVTLHEKKKKREFYDENEDMSQMKKRYRRSM